MIRGVWGAAGCLALAACWLAVGSGCVTETRTTYSTTSSDALIGARETRSAPSRPRGLVASQMLLAVPPPLDRDGNGRVDTLLVQVYLFGDSDEYPLPLTEPGVFEFELRSEGGEPLGRWIFPAEQARAAVRELEAGPGYGFGLQLREEVEGMPERVAGVTALFRSMESGREVRSTGSATVRVGAGRR